MKYLIPAFLFLFIFPNNSNAQKKDWTNSGLVHFGVRPGNWTMDQWGKFPVQVNNTDTVFTTGLHGAPTPVYLSVEQMGKYFYWNFDGSCGGNSKTKFTNKDDYFQPAISGFDVKGRVVTASFVAAAGYLFKGRFGIYAGGRLGYDNVVLKLTGIANPNDEMQQLGGKKIGYNFHLLFPLIGGMFRFSYFSDVTKNHDMNLKAKTSEMDFSWFIPFNKDKTGGLMLALDHLAYSTKNYLAAFQSLNNSQEINFKRTYFQIGFVVPVF